MRRAAWLGRGSEVRGTGMRHRLGALLAAASMLGGLLAVAGAPVARACSCMARPAAEMLGDADGAFVGVYQGGAGPLEADLGRPLQNVVHHFRVDQVVKGVDGDQIEVWSSGSSASCGLSLEVGSRVGLVVYRDERGWTSGLCNTVDSVELAALAPPGSPSSTSTDSGTREALMAGIPIVAVVGISLAVMRSRRFRKDQSA